MWIGGAAAFVLTEPRPDVRSHVSSLLSWGYLGPGIKFYSLSCKVEIF